MKFKKKISAYCIGLGLLGASVAPVNSAQAAGWLVSDINLLSYLSGMMTNGGDGVVELLTSINVAISQGNAINKNDSKNQIRAQNEIDKINLRNDAIDKRIPDRSACTAATTASSGGGAAANTAKSGYSSNKAMSEKLEKPLSEAFKFEASLKDKVKLGVCSEEDVRLKVAQCSQAGEFSGQDISANSVLFKPLSKQDENKGYAPIGSLTKEEQDVRNKAIEVLVGIDTMDQLKDSFKANSLEGSEYLYLKNQEFSRKTMAQGALLKNAALDNQMTPSEAKRMLGELEWGAGGANSPREVWKSAFGDSVKFPENPSEWDILTYNVYSYFGNTGDEEAFQIRLGSMTEDEVLKSIARMDAIQLRIQMMQLESQRDSNRLLSTMLAIMVEGKSKADISNIEKNVDIKVD